MIRGFLARRLTPLIWRISPRRSAQAMREYSLIEKDSGCQILDALTLVEEPATRALLFQQVLEEFHHSDIFEDVCRDLSDAPIGTPVITRDALVGSNPGPDTLLDLLAYVHVGEAAVDADFAEYARARIDPSISRAFARVRADEHRHVADSRGLLEPFAPGRARWAVAKARALRAWRSYLKTMSSIGEIALSILLTALYALAGPLRGPCRRRLEAAPEAQLEIFREQWRRASSRR